MDKLSHTDEKGKANMVDVGHKPDQLRVAKAIGEIRLDPGTIKMIKENQMMKGDVLTVAEIAGIQAGKKTDELIPLCHPLQLSKLEVKTALLDDRITVTGIAKCVGKTGVEMEALTAVSVALLTLYDMCKAVDKKMEIGNIKLVEKTKTDL